MRHLDGRLARWHRSHEKATDQEQPDHAVPRLVGAITAVIALLAGIATSAEIGHVVEQSEARHATDVVDQRSQAVQAAVASESQRYVDTLTNLAVSFGAQSDLTVPDFMAITSALPSQVLRGATGVSLVVPASDHEVNDVQALWRARGQSELTLQPSGTGVEHRFTVASRPLNASLATLGRDINQTVEPTEAMDVARATGRAAASRTYVLFRDRSLPVDQQQLSFVIAAPIYGSGTSTDTGKFRGWVVMALHGRDFMNTTLYQVAQSLVNVTLFDDTVASQPLPVAKLDNGKTASSLKGKSVSVMVAQRPWKLTIEPTTHLVRDSGGYLGESVAVAGSLITALTIMLMWSLFTSRRRALREVATATTALRHDIDRRERVEAELRSFAGIVAHDLRSPLTAVIGFSSLLQNEGQRQLDESGKQLVRQVVKSADRMRVLIEDLLSYATVRDSPLDVDLVDLREVVDEVISERAGHLERERPRFDVADLPVVEADRGMVRQLVDNLIGNAIKYVPEGTVPHISVSAAHSTEANREEWRVEIADNGIGVPPEARESIFESFHRADRTRAGTGLGLAICERVVRRHGGDIGVFENDGGGSKFWFTLPAQDDATDDR